MTKNQLPWKSHLYFTEEYLLRSPYNYCAKCGGIININPQKISNNNFWQNNPNHITRVGFCHNYDCSGKDSEDFIG